MAGEPNIWALARRQTLLKSSRFRLNLKVAENKENFKKHPFRIRFYYRFVKRPTIRFVYTPARNLILDYNEVAKDLVKYAKTSPFWAALSWASFFLAVASYWKRPVLEDYERDFRELAALSAPISDSSMNSNAYKFVKRNSEALGRGQIKEMNFFFFTLFYMDKYSERNWNPLATCDEMQLSFSEKFSSAVDIGWLGSMWLNRWHTSDLDIPTRNEDDKELKDEESQFSAFIRRIRMKPKFENLIVEERIPRNARAEGLPALLPQN